MAGNTRVVLRLSLRTRLMVLASLQLVLLAGVAAWALRVHFSRLEDWLLPDVVRERIRAMAVVLDGELRATSMASWDEVVARLGEAYGGSFALYGPDGWRFAGDVGELPAVVAERVIDPPFLVAGAPRTRRGGRPPWPQEEVVRAEGASRLWLLVRLPLQRPPPMPGGARGEGGVPGPLMPGMVLVGRMGELGATSLLFDPRPWVAGGVAVVAGSLLLWVPFARSVTRAVEQMAAATEAMAEGRFGQAVDEGRGDELGRLAGAINRLGVRLGAFVHDQKRFLGAAAHELVSPLARIEMGLGVVEQRAPPELLERLEGVREDAAHLRVVAEDLLAFSRAGLRVERGEPVDVDVGAVVAVVLQREARGADVRVSVPTGLAVRGYEDLLAQALGNLVRNAVRYAGHAGPIEVRARVGARCARIAVLDRGPGVPEAALPRLFEAFYRPDAARTREQGGAGLGLAIVRSAVEACGGAAGVELRKGGGLEAWVEVPVAEILEKRGP